MNNFDNFNAVVAALIANKGVIIDTHNGQRKERKADGIAALVKGDVVKPVLLSDVEYFSLNLVELEDDGTVVLSDESVGGVVNPAKFGGDLRKALIGYNAEQPGLIYSCGNLEQVYLFKHIGVEFHTLKLSTDLTHVVQGAEGYLSSKHTGEQVLRDLEKADVLLQVDIPAPDRPLAERLLEKSRAPKLVIPAPEVGGYQDTAKPLADVLLERNRGVQPKATDDIGGSGAAIPVNEE